MSYEASSPAFQFALVLRRVCGFGFDYCEYHLIGCSVSECEWECLYCKHNCCKKALSIFIVTWSLSSCHGLVARDVKFSLTRLVPDKCNKNDILGLFTNFMHRAFCKWKHGKFVRKILFVYPFMVNILADSFRYRIETVWDRFGTGIQLRILVLRPVYSDTTSSWVK